MPAALTKPNPYPIYRTRSKTQTLQPSMDTAYHVARLCATVSLYALLACALWTLWTDIRSAQRILSLASQPAGQLVELPSNKFFPLMPICSIGRAGTNAITIEDPAVSLQHALITRRDLTWWLEDLNSRNGTYLNEHRLDEAAVITSGDIISVGHTQLQINIGFTDGSQFSHTP